MQLSTALRPSQRNKIGRMTRDEGIVRSIEEGSPVTRPAGQARKVRLPWCRGCQCRWCVGSCRARAWTWIWRAGRAPGAGCADPPAQARAPSSPAIAFSPPPSSPSSWSPTKLYLHPAIRVSHLRSALYLVELHTMIRAKTVKHLTPLSSANKIDPLALCFRCASATEGEKRKRGASTWGRGSTRQTDEAGLLASLYGVGSYWAHDRAGWVLFGFSVLGFSSLCTRDMTRLRSVGLAKFVISLNFDKSSFFLSSTPKPDKTSSLIFKTVHLTSLVLL